MAQGKKNTTPPAFTGGQLTAQKLAELIAVRLEAESWGAIEPRYFRWIANGEDFTDDDDTMALAKLLDSVAIAINQGDF